MKMLFCFCHQLGEAKSKRKKKGLALGFQEFQSRAPPNVAGRRDCEGKATFLGKLWSSPRAAPPQVLDWVSKNKHMAALRNH